VALLPSLTVTAEGCVVMTGAVAATELEALFEPLLSPPPQAVNAIAVTASSIEPASLVASEVLKNDSRWASLFSGSTITKDGGDAIGPAMRSLGANVTKSALLTLSDTTAGCRDYPMQMPCVVHPTQAVVPARFRSRYLLGDSLHMRVKNRVK